MEENRLIFDCPGLTDGGTIPAEYTGRGQDRSPEFLLRNLSPEAATLAVTLEDLTHPVPQFTHWIIWNIPAAGRIPGGITPGKQVPALKDARQGIGYGLHRYAGPKPPRGRTHTYRFTVYALDCALDLSANSTKKAFLKRAAGHILQAGSISGQFE